MTTGERQGLDVEGVRRWYDGALAALRRYRDEIDDENVYPVADGDTGTNMLATIEAGWTAARAVETGRVGDVIRAFADGALLGAKGNSGLILSQLLRGLAAPIGSRRTVSAAQLRDALDAAAKSAYASVGVPVEGTILSVVAAAAEAARKAKGDVAAVAAAASVGARAALARTTAQLPVLKRAGVVDAGGRGLVLVLDALAVATGARLQQDARPSRRRRRSAADAAASEGGSHEVVYLFDADDAASRELRAALIGLGDSVVVAGGAPVFKVHVHTDVPDEAVRAGQQRGRLRELAITALHDEQPCAVRSALVVTTGCPGVRRVLESAGVDCVLDATCSQGDVQLAVRQTRASDVIVIADSPRAAASARRIAASSRESAVYVVGVRSAVQLLAAVSVHDGERAAAEDVEAMTTAAAATRVSVIRAATDPVRAARRACDRMLSAGGERVTILAGADCPAAATEGLLAHLARAHPDVDVHRFDGGQRDSLMLIGVE